MNNPPEENHPNAYRLPTLPKELPPLTIPRTREPHVEKQGAEILTGTRTEALRRLRIADKTHPDALVEETLLALCRLYQRYEYSSEFIEAAMQTLFARAAKTVTKQAHRWHQMSPSEREDYLNDVRTCLLEWMTTLDAKGEFWEVKYARCLRYLYLDTSRHYEKFTKNEEEAISAFGDDEDSERDRIERTEDFTLPDMDERLHWEFALKLLSPKERQAVALIYHQCSQEQIAKHLGYKDARSVRYLMKSVQEKLKQWN